MTDLIEKLQAAIVYDPDTGEMRWRVALPRTPAGTNALRRGPKGKLIVRFGGMIYYANRVAWLLGHQVEPSGHVLPNDGNPDNLRLVNLKDVSHADAARLQKRRSSNTSGHRGVSWSAQTGKWIASITKNYRRYHLGHFATKEEAIDAYRLAETGPETRSLHSSELPRHPQYARRQRWIGQKALMTMPALAGFLSYEQVIAECGAVPSDEHVLMRPNISLPLGPGNAAWRLPYARAGEKIRYNHARLGFSPTQYNRLLAAQDGKCAICRREEREPEEGEGRSLVLDHDHETNAIRGILCNDCNRAIGLLGENYERVAAVVEYLRLGQFDVAETLGLCASCQKTLPKQTDYMLALDGDGGVLGPVCSGCESRLDDIYRTRPALRRGDPILMPGDPEKKKKAAAGGSFKMSLSKYNAIAASQTADHIERHARSDKEGE